MLRRLPSGRPVKKTSLYGAIKAHSGFPYGEKAPYNIRLRAAFAEETVQAALSASKTRKKYSTCYAGKISIGPTGGRSKRTGFLGQRSSRKNKRLPARAKISAKGALTKTVGFAAQTEIKNSLPQKGVFKTVTGPPVPAVLARQAAGAFLGGPC